MIDILEENKFHFVDSITYESVTQAKQGRHGDLISFEILNGELDVSGSPTTPHLSLFLRTLKVTLKI